MKMKIASPLVVLLAFALAGCASMDGTGLHPGDSASKVESVMGHKRNDDDSWNYVIDPENKICYVRLTQFSGNTTRALEQLMAKLNKALDAYAKAHGITLILDVTKIQGIVSAAESLDITKAFITEFNSKNPATASLTPTP